MFNIRGGEPSEIQRFDPFPWNSVSSTILDHSYRELWRVQSFDQSACNSATPLLKITLAKISCSFLGRKRVRLYEVSLYGLYWAAGAQKGLWIWFNLLILWQKLIYFWVTFWMFQKIVASGMRKLFPREEIVFLRSPLRRMILKKGQAMVQTQLLDKLEHGRIPMDKSSERLRFWMDLNGHWVNGRYG